MSANAPAIPERPGAVAAQETAVGSCFDRGHTIRTSTRANESESTGAQSQVLTAGGGGRAGGLGQWYSAFSLFVYPQSCWSIIQVIQTKTPWPLVRKRTIPTERPPLVDEI
jgi:hypothetical protein